MIMDIQIKQTLEFLITWIQKAFWETPEFN